MIITLRRRRGIRLWWALLKSVPMLRAILARSDTNYLRTWWLALRLAFCGLCISRRLRDGDRN